MRRPATQGRSLPVGRACVMYAAAGEGERVGAEWGLCYRDSSPTGGLKSESPMPTYSQRPRSQGKSQTPSATPLPPALHLSRGLIWRPNWHLGAKIDAAAQLSPCHHAPLLAVASPPAPPNPKHRRQPESQRTPPPHGRSGRRGVGELDQKAGKATCEWRASRDTEVGAGKSTPAWGLCSVLRAPISRASSCTAAARPWGATGRRAMCYQGGAPSGPVRAVTPVRPSQSAVGRPSKPAATADIVDQSGVRSMDPGDLPSGANRRCAAQGRYRR